MHHRMRFKYFPAPAFEVLISVWIGGDQSFPFPAESQLEWALLRSPPQFHLSWVKPASPALLLGRTYKSTTQPSHGLPYMILSLAPFAPVRRTESHFILSASG